MGGDTLTSGTPLEIASTKPTRFEDDGGSLSLSFSLAFCLRYSLALRGMTTAGEAMASLENFGVWAGPKGEDDIQLEEGSRDLEGGCLAVLASESGDVGRGDEREYACGIVGDGTRGWTGNDAGREWP